jgi:hypothetical protein
MELRKLLGGKSAKRETSKVNRQNNDVEVQIIAFRARKIGSKAEALQGEPW